MKYAKLIFYVGLIFQLFSCHNIEHSTKFHSEIIWEHQKDLELSTNGENHLSYFALQFIKYKGEPAVTYYVKKTRKIYIYSIKTTKKLKTINVNYFKHRDVITNFKYLSPDSILLVYLSSYPITAGKVNDSTFLMVNEQGKILKSYNMENSNFRTISNPYIDKSKEKSIFIAHSELFLSKNEVFIPTYSPWVWLGKSNFDKSIPVAGKLNTIKNKFNFVNNLKFPNDFYLDTWGHQLNKRSLMFEQVSFFQSFDGSVMATFSQTPFIYKLNNGELIKLTYIKSSNIDTVYSQKSLKENNITTQQGYYGMVKKNIAKKHYLRRLYLPQKINGTIQEKNQKNYGILIFDKYWKKLAEGKYPAEIKNSSAFFISDEGIVYFYNKEKSQHDGNKFILSAYNYKIKNQNYNEKSCEAENLSNSEMNNNGYIKYFKKYHKIPKKNSTAVVIYVPVEESCPYCVQQMYKTFDKLIQEFPDHELYLLATTESQTAMNQTKQSKNFPKAHPHLKTDASGRHLNYILRAINPRVFLLDEKKVVKAFDVMPVDAPLVEGYIRTFFSGQTPIIK